MIDKGRMKSRESFREFRDGILLKIPLFPGRIQEYNSSIATK